MAIGWGGGGKVHFRQAWGYLAAVWNVLADAAYSEVLGGGGGGVQVRQAWGYLAAVWNVLAEAAYSRVLGGGGGGVWNVLADAAYSGVLGGGGGGGSAGASSLRVPSGGVKCPSRSRLQPGLKLLFPQTQEF